MVYYQTDVTTNGPLSLTLRGNNFPQELHLALNKKPIYLIGNTCGTCSAIFERIQNNELPLSSNQVGQKLEQGLNSIPQNIVETVNQLLPKGQYIIGLLETIASMERPRSRREHANFCRADYFWLQHLGRQDWTFKNEIILPIYQEKLLDEERISYYTQAIENGARPTALAFSIFDIRVPMGGSYFEWTLAHFLLDGHHKVMAASRIKKPISILSFLLLNGPFCSVNLEDETIQKLYNRKV